LPQRKNYTHPRDLFQIILIRYHIDGQVFKNKNKAAFNLVTSRPDEIDEYY